MSLFAFLGLSANTGNRLDAAEAVAFPYACVWENECVRVHTHTCIYTANAAAVAFLGRGEGSTSPNAELPSRARSEPVAGPSLPLSSSPSSNATLTPSFPTSTTVRDPTPISPEMKTHLRNLNVKIAALGLGVAKANQGSESTIRDFGSQLHK